MINNNNTMNQRKHGRKTLSIIAAVCTLSFVFFVRKDYSKKTNHEISYHNHENNHYAKSKRHATKAEYGGTYEFTGNYAEYAITDGIEGFQMPSNYINEIPAASELNKNEKYGSDEQNSYWDTDFEKDPMLKKMPDVDFEAYVRADIATFYREKPGNRTELKPSFDGQAGKFVNMYPQRVSVWWEGPKGPMHMTEINAWGSGGSGVYPAHSFIFTKENKADKILCRITIVTGTSVYYCDPFAELEDEDNFNPARGVQVDPKEPMSLDTLPSYELTKYNAHKFNLQFGAMYKQFTGGSEWLAMYPPLPPRHKMWRADYFGQTHTVTTTETHFEKVPSKMKLNLSIEDMREGKNDEVAKPYAEYRAPGSMNLTIKALSCGPRVFEVKNFLSDAEVDHMLEIIQARKLQRSKTGVRGGEVSETRTSSTAWLKRETDPVLNAIYRRVADALRIDEALLRKRDNGEVPEIPSLSRVNEDLQIVHYNKGEQFTAHHDFQYPKTISDKRARSINLGMYLNDVPAGGKTSFPRWRNAETTGSLDMTPEKGKAVIFYMVNPDGNLDDLSQNAALPVLEGEEYFANLWISTY